MSSFQYFQHQAGQQSKKSQFPADTFSLSGLLQYAETAQKRSFEALCHLRPLVKTYRDKVEETSRAIIQAESSFEAKSEIPETYAAALELVKKSFTAHLEALENWMRALEQKTESQSDDAMGKVKQSGERLEASLLGLKVPD